MEERFLAAADDYLGDYLRRIQHCVELLTEEQVWWRPNGASNSVGNLLLHLTGNLSQWVLAALGQESYQRHRSAEFSADRTGHREDLLEGLSAVVARARAVVRGLGPNDLRRTVHVQGYDMDGLGIVFHVVEHMSYHTGQVVMVTKQLQGEYAGIEFYPQHRGE